MSARVCIRARSSAAVLIAALALTGLRATAAEKATITPPTGSTNNPANLAPAKSSGIPFSPLDGGRSLGGVMDSGGGLPAVPPPTPDPRTQKELIERLDRKRNFLLIDPDEKPVTRGKLELYDPEAKADNTRNPLRPETALERRLKKSNRDTTAENAEDEKRWKKEGKGGTETDNDFADADKRRSVSDPFDDPDEKSTRSSPFSLPNLSNPSELGKAPEPRTIDDIRSALSEAGGRGIGNDAFTRERTERYQKSSGDGPFAVRGLAADSTDFGRSRELRSDVADPAWSRSSAASLTDLRSGPASSSALASPPSLRSSSLESFTTTAGSSSFAPAPTASPAAASPASRLLNEPRPEPPRFRP